MYYRHFVLCLCGVSLSVESLEDLKKLLKQSGCSVKACSEILKWYGQDGVDNHILKEYFHH